MVAAVDNIVRSNGTAKCYYVDVTSKDLVRDVVGKVVRDFGKIDVLINAAGIMLIRPLTEINTGEWETTIDLNSKGTLWGIAAVLPLFLKQESGHIINLGSPATRCGSMARLKRRGGSRRKSSSSSQALRSRGVDFT